MNCDTLHIWLLTRPYTLSAPPSTLCSPSFPSHPLVSPARTYAVKTEEITTAKEFSRVLCSEKFSDHHYSYSSSSTHVRHRCRTKRTVDPHGNKSSIINKLLEFALQCLLALLGPWIVNNAAAFCSATSTQSPPWTMGAFTISVLVTVCAWIDSMALRGPRRRRPWLLALAHSAAYLSATSALANLASMLLGAAYRWIPYVVACFLLVCFFHDPASAAVV